MTENKEKIFVKGMFFELPSDNAPEYIKGKLSIKVSDLIQFMNDHENVGGYVNIDLKVAKESGKGYCQLNTWKPSDKQYKAPATKEVGAVPTGEGIEYPEEQINSEDIPF